uniref:Innexin n=1 Tax=Timema tahoe TaxID=61484 RepID=A0A7R9IMI1_9NEOP|nr:unnamed protein product [Timema tahoe]
MLTYFVWSVSNKQTYQQSLLSGSIIVSQVLTDHTSSELLCVACDCCRIDEECYRRVRLYKSERGGYVSILESSGPAASRSERDVSSVRFLRTLLCRSQFGSGLPLFRKYHDNECEMEGNLFQTFLQSWMRLQATRGLYTPRQVSRLTGYVLHSPRDNSRLKTITHLTRATHNPPGRIKSCNTCVRFSHGGIASSPDSEIPVATSGTALVLPVQNILVGHEARLCDASHLVLALITGTLSTRLQSGTLSTRLQSGTLSTRLQSGTLSTRLRSGTLSTRLRSGTLSTRLRSGTLSTRLRSGTLSTRLRSGTLSTRLRSGTLSTRLRSGTLSTRLRSGTLSTRLRSGTLSTRLRSGTLSTRLRSGTLSTRLRSGTLSTRLRSGTLSTRLRSGTLSTRLRSGTLSTRLRSGTLSTRLRSGTLSTRLRSGTLSTRLRSGTSVTKMAVFGLVSAVAGFVKVRYLVDKAIIDNMVFRCHYRITSAIFFVCCILCTANNLIGDPINCINDGAIPGHVINTFCWITSTFTLPHQQGKPVGTHVVHPGVGTIGDHEKETRYHAYYQWVPFMLFFQGVLFYIPHWIWKNWEEGKIRMISEGIRGAMISSKDERKDKQTRLVQYIIDTMHLHNMYAAGYFLCEALNFVNVVSGWDMDTLSRDSGGLELICSMSECGGLANITEIVPKNNYKLLD